MHIGHDHVERRRHDADRAAGQHDALVVEAGHQHIDALALLAEHVLERHLAILEHQFAGIRPAHAELVELLRGGKSVETLLDQEGRDAARARIRIGLGVDDQRRGIRPVGDPHLVAVEDVAVVALFGPELHRHDVGAGARFAHRKRTDMLARKQFRQVFRLLLRRRPAVDLVDAEVGMGAVGQPDRGRRPADLLDSDRVREIAHRRAAIGLRHRDSVQAERAHLFPQIHRKFVRRVDLRGARRDLVGGKAANHVAQRLDLLAEPESHSLVKHVPLAPFGSRRCPEPLIRRYPRSSPATAARRNGTTC